jgi:type I restriction enzyme R subunit
MAKHDKTPAHIKLDERNHVEKPLLDQLAGLGWEVLDLDNKQPPAASLRGSFTDVVMEPVLREQIGRINPWMEPDQIDEVIKQLTASFPGNNLIENNRHLLGLLLENTSVGENRQTGEQSPTVRFIDFEAEYCPGQDSANRFIAVCQLHLVPRLRDCESLYRSANARKLASGPSPSIARGYLRRLGAVVPGHGDIPCKETSL